MDYDTPAHHDAEEARALRRPEPEHPIGHSCARCLREEFRPDEWPATP